MAALSAQVAEKGFNVVVATWDGFGEASATAFPGIVEEARQVCQWVEAHVPHGLAGLVGCGMGGQVAIEAVCEDAGTARCLMAGDVLCQEVPGTGGSARLTSLAFRMMGAPARSPLTPDMAPGQVEAVMERCAPRVKRRARYVASQMEGLALPRALAPQFVRAVSVTPRATAAAMTRAAQGWRVPSDVRAVACPVLLTAGGLESRPYRESADDLHRALPQSRLQVARDLGRNELYLRSPQRAAELLLPLLRSV